MNILIVRLGALGDIVHAVPAAAALREALPDARIDWLVEARHRAILDLLPILDRIVMLEGRSPAAWVDVVRRLRQVRYDLAFDMQGLMKSAVLARASGARRVAGFSIWHLREKAARGLYSMTDGSRETAAAHVIQKNLHLLRTIGLTSEAVTFPFAIVESPVVATVKAAVRDRPFALLNPGAAWPNKRWPPARFGEVAAFLQEVRGMRAVVVWGPGERGLAQAVVEASNGAAIEGPPSGVADLLALCRAASLVVTGDTGPMHIAAAAGTPVVGIFGPTDPLRNGPWSPHDVVVSRFASCGCHYDRRCHRASWCLEDVAVAEVTAAVQQRLGRVADARGGSGHV
jgi:lipopolysaccharide heptosyltransferase I